MKTRALTLAALAAAVVGPGLAAAQQPNAALDRFAGTWQGALNLGATRLRLAFITQRDSAGLTGSFVSIDQSNQRLPATFSIRGDTLIASMTAIGATYTGVISVAADSLHGTFKQSGATFPLALTRVAALSTVSRPQDPKPPFLYKTEDVAFESIPGVRLAGTLSVPQGNGPFAAAVLVSGSGPQDRDGSLMGHRPFAVLADYLTRNGIAVLRYDDRGTSNSTGRFMAATTEDFARDAEAAVRFLRTRPEIAASSIGIIGHSEGGLIGPMVASRSGDVAFVVVLAAPGIPGDSLLILQQRLVAAAAGATAAAIDANEALSRRIFPILRSNGDSSEIANRVRAELTSHVATLPPEQRRALTASAIERQVQEYVWVWMRYFVAYDPRPALQRLKVPVLAINGTLDVQVPAKESLSAIETALKAGGNPDYRIVEMPGLNHLLQTAKTGAIGEYGTIEETMSPQVLELVSSWIRERFPKK